MKKFLILAGALALSTPLIAAGPDLEVLITKVDQDSIDDYVAIDLQNVVVHTKYGEYFAIFFAMPCQSTTGKETPYFVPNSQGSFGKGDIARFKKEKCAAASVMKSGPPPPKAKPKS